MNKALQWNLRENRFGYNIFELSQNGEKVLALAYDPDTQSARLDCDISKRAFRIEKAGFLKNRTVLKNEYGVNIAQLAPEKNHANEGVIELEDQRLFYSINSLVDELVVFKHASQQFMVNCNFASLKDALGLKKKNKNQLDDYSPLLMALGWFLFLPSKVEAVA